MTGHDIAKSKQWKKTEQLNARRALAKAKPLLRSLGFTPLSTNGYRIDMNGKPCKLSVLKLARTPRFRILGSVEGRQSDLLVSDEFTYNGHPSGLKFSLDVSRFGDNSDACAQQITAFVKSVALPWFDSRTKLQSHA